jgi:hypothetical protein
MPALLQTLVLGLTLSCSGGGPTEIVLVVDTDIETPDAIDRIEISLSGDRGTPTNVVADLTAAGTPELPLTLTAFAGDGGSGALAVTVVGRLAGAEVARWEARTTFVDGETRMLYAILAARCLTIECPSGQTCDQAGCREVAIAREALRDWPGAPPVLDGPACEPSDERCNLYDDDCDEVIDEGIDVSTDAANCGLCGRACAGGEACGGGYCESERAIDIATGGAHACAVRQGGTVACWGWNVYGQLGDGTFIDNPLPSEVVGVTGATDVSAGVAHTCAVAGADVYCWGDNFYGELGDGTNVPRRTAAPVGLVGASAVTAGVAHTCALTSAGDVACWGDNFVGQVGNDTLEAALTPQMVLVGASVTSVSAGDLHTCASHGDGAVSCWGANSTGQLGSGLIDEDARVPRPVMAVATAAEVVAGRAHTCARLTDGTVQCWGENSQGQLGVGIAGPGGMTPRPVSMLADAMGLATGAAGSHVCTTTSTGASCWGANATGQLGDLPVDDALAPVSMADITSPPATISTGGSGSGGAGYTCLLESTGAVRCIGDGGLGQLGQGAFQSSFELVEARLRQ